MDGLRMNNHPTPTTPDEAKLRPVWSTLPLQGRVRRLSAIADIAICNRPGSSLAGDARPRTLAIGAGIRPAFAALAKRHCTGSGQPPPYLSNDVHAMKGKV